MLPASNVVSSYTPSAHEGVLPTVIVDVVKNAYCVGLREYFNDGNALPMYTEITIAAGQLLFGEGDDCVFRMID